MLIRRSDDAARPLGVIACLRAGFEIVSRRPWLVLFPVVLDLLLWLGPRLSFDPAWVADLVNGYISLAKGSGALDAAALTQLEQMAALLTDAGERLNLFSLVSLAPQLNLPTLTGHPTALYYRAAVESPFGARHALLVSGVGPLAGWIALLLPLGLLLAYLYLVGLAGPVCRLRRARLDEPLGAFGQPGTDPFTTEDRRARLRGYAARLGQLLLFAACALLAVAVALPVLGGALAASATVSLGLGVMMGMLGTGLAYYFGLQLAFVVPAIVLGGRRFLPAIRESVTILYVDSGPTTMFVIALALLYQVSGALWSLAEPDSWALAAAIVGNACVATGLTAAAFVFYQERAVRLRRLPRPTDQPSRSSDESEEETE